MCFPTMDLRRRSSTGTGAACHMSGPLSSLHAILKVLIVCGVHYHTPSLNQAPSQDGLLVPVAQLGALPHMMACTGYPAEDRSAMAYSGGRHGPSPYGPVAVIECGAIDGYHTPHADNVPVSVDVFSTQGTGREVQPAHAPNEVEMEHQDGCLPHIHAGTTDPRFPCWKRDHDLRSDNEKDIADSTAGLSEVRARIVTLVCRRVQKDIDDASPDSMTDGKVNRLFSDRAEALGEFTSFSSLIRPELMFPNFRTGFCGGTAMR